MNGLQPTKRFMIEPLLLCNIKCKFCYHLHKYEQWKDYTKPLDEIVRLIDAGIKRGNQYMDVTGGEPTIYDHIIETIQYATGQGIGSCIITNGLAGELIVDNIMKAGLKDWLVSIHGIEDTHNYLTNCTSARRRQIRFLNQIKGMTYRFNCVLSKFNENEILDTVKFMLKWKPHIVNFINMNPHHEWMSKEFETKSVVADLSKIKPDLEEAIHILEDNGIGVNVRYFPMCCLTQSLRRTVCNDLHVTLDPYEWDYCIEPKTEEEHINWGIGNSEGIEHKDKPCSICDLKNICGGVNKGFFKATNGAHIRPVRNPGVDKNDYAFYRRHNIMTLRCNY